MNRGGGSRERDQPRETIALLAKSLCLYIYIYVVQTSNASFRENTLVSNGLHDRWPFDVRYLRLEGKFATYRV